MLESTKDVAPHEELKKFSRMKLTYKIWHNISFHVFLKTQEHIKMDISFPPCWSFNIMILMIPKWLHTTVLSGNGICVTESIVCPQSEPSIKQNRALDSYHYSLIHPLIIPVIVDQINLSSLPSTWRVSNSDARWSHPLFMSCSSSWIWCTPTVVCYTMLRKSLTFC